MASESTSTTSERGCVGHITIAGDEVGEFQIIEKHPDGSMLIAPEPPAAAWLREIGASPILSEAELEAEAGPLGQYDDEE